MSKVDGSKASRRWVALIAVLALVITSVVEAPGADAGGKPFPDAIELPDGFVPEGIAMDGSSTNGYVGSLAGGAIQKIDVRTGESTPFAPALGAGVLAVGMATDDHGRLWVAAGGPALFPTTVPGFRIYDTDTGDLLVDQQLAAGFVNDVWVTSDAAWFTDSFSPNLIRVPIAADGAIGVAEFVTMTGEWVQPAGFGANGIIATANQKNLIVAQATGPEPGTSALYVLALDNDATSIEATRIALDEQLLSGDGLVLNGRTLYVVGGPGVTKIKLGHGLSAGTVVDVLAVPDALTPTTAAAFGSRLYVVDAKFPLIGDPTTPFQVSSIPR